jgi:hypothetical protein
MAQIAAAGPRSGPALVPSEERVPPRAAPADESANFTVETLTTKLNRPWGLAIRPPLAATDQEEIFISERGAQRVVKLAPGQLPSKQPGSDSAESTQPVIVGFPAVEDPQGNPRQSGPLGLLFLNRSKLVVGSCGSERGQLVLQVYRLPNDGSSISADQVEHSVGPSRIGPDSKGLPPEERERPYFGMIKANDDTLFTTSYDANQGWILKAPVQANRLVGLQILVETTKQPGASRPSGITFLPDPALHYLVVGHAGDLEMPRDSMLSFYSPQSGSVALHLRTGLHDIVGLAYSPSGQLYAIDCAWNFESDGGVYRLDDAMEHGRQTCRPCKIASIPRPTAFTFSKAGAMLITALGSSAEQERQESNQGVLLKITGPL